MKKLKIGVILLPLFVLLIVLSTVICASANSRIILPVSVTMDGRTVLDGENQAMIVDAVTYVPLRSYCNLMGNFTIDWDNQTRTATVNATGLNITVTEGERFITVNDRCFYCAQDNFIIDGTLYVPVRVISKAYGVNVGWVGNGESGTVLLEPTGERAARADDTYDADVLYWLSRIISAESRGESLEGQIAVGNVVLNRVHSDEFPDTVYDVVFDKKFGVQFTPVSNGTIYDTPSAQSVNAAKICLEGTTVSERILYFLNVAASSNLWVPNNRGYVMTLGCHSFYS